MYILLHVYAVDSLFFRSLVVFVNKAMFILDLIFRQFVYLQNNSLILYILNGKLVTDFVHIHEN